MYDKNKIDEQAERESSFIKRHINNTAIENRKQGFNRRKLLSTDYNKSLFEKMFA